MKKLFLGVAGLLVALSYATTVYAGVNDFVISDYQMDMNLGRDSSGRSTLSTKERITAQFPNYDQNHGIERAIPNNYDGHSTHLMMDFSLGSKGDSTNNSSTYTNNDNTVVRYGSADTYVHGTKTYELSYAQRDVTKYFADTKDDEFYWDTNGTDWRVPIQNLTVNVHVDGALAAKLNGAQKCYQGVSGATNLCELTKTGNTFSVQAQNLAAGENLTVAIGFQPGTFAAYQPSLWERAVEAWKILTYLSSFAAVAAFIWIGVKWSKLSDRKSEIGTVIPEYLPPKETSVTAAADVVDKPKAVMTAQLLDLAVRHYIRIYQTQEKTLFKKPQYDIEIVKSLDDLKWEEKEILSDMFGGLPQVGARLALKSLQNNSQYSMRLLNNDGGVRQRVRGEYGLREKKPEAGGWFKRTGIVMLIISVVALSPLMFFAAIGSFIYGFALWRLTDKGLDLRRYLMGLKEYISVAETDRIKMLQSPEGAEKTGVSVGAGDQSQLIKLYERVLPYAVLFGQEKQWNQQLGQYYEVTNTQPDWYRGVSTFNAVNFASGMSSFATSASYGAPTSSSSGGSGGGGFSGGGGGGGGGGGW